MLPAHNESQCTRSSSMNGYWLVLLVVAPLIKLPILCTAENCKGVPKIDLLYQVLKELIAADSLDIKDFSYTCLVQGTRKNTYQELSVMVFVETRNHQCQVQFEMDCTKISNGEVWEYRRDTMMAINSCSITECVLTEENACCVVPNKTNYVIKTRHNESMGAIIVGSTRQDCSACVASNNPPNNHHCQSCDDSCYTGVGLGRCTGPTTEDCCMAFDEEGFCINTTNCKGEHFVADMQNNYTCGCSLYCEAGYAPNLLCTECVTDITKQEFCSNASVQPNKTQTQVCTHTTLTTCKISSSIEQLLAIDGVPVVIASLGLLVLLLCVVIALVIMIIAHSKLRKAMRNRKSQFLSTSHSEIHQRDSHDNTSTNTEQNVVLRHYATINKDKQSGKHLTQEHQHFFYNDIATGSTNTSFGPTVTQTEYAGLKNSMDTPSFYTDKTIPMEATEMQHFQSASQIAPSPMYAEIDIARPRYK